MRRSTVLLTGFGPFPGVVENISGPLVEAVAADVGRHDVGQNRVGVDKRTVCAKVLPTEWHGAPAHLDRLLDGHAPDVVLHFGVSRAASGFLIETIAENVCRSAPDALGELPPSALLCAESPRGLEATIPIGVIVSRLRQAGFAATASNDAGGYLCNAVLFRSLRWSLRRDGGGTRRIGFVHVPDDPEAVGLSFDTLVRGAGLILATCLERGSGAAVA